MKNNQLAAFSIALLMTPIIGFANLSPANEGKINFGGTVAKAACTL